MADIEPRSGEIPDRFQIDWDTLIPASEPKPDIVHHAPEIPWEQASGRPERVPLESFDAAGKTEAEEAPVEEAPAEETPDEAAPVEEPEAEEKPAESADAAEEKEAEEPVSAEQETTEQAAVTEPQGAESAGDEGKEDRTASSGVFIHAKKKPSTLIEELLSFGREVDSGRTETHPSWELPAQEQEEAVKKVDPEKVKKSRSRFLMGLLIYVAAFLVLAFAVLTVLRRYAVAYERSQITDYLSAYETSMTADEPREACLTALESLRQGTSSEEENVRWMQELLKEASFVKLSDRSSAELLVYGIRARDEQIGTVSFCPGEDLGFDKKSWVLADEEYDFSAFTHSLDFTIPENYTVRVNGVTLGSEYIVERDIPYELLAECYERFEGLPHMVRYESGNWLGDAEVEVLNAAGVVQREDQLTESVYLDNCPEEIRELADAFMPVFIDAYVVFTANLYGASYNNFMQLKTYVLNESDLHIRMRQAIESFGYTTTHEAEVVSMNINALTSLGDDRYLADVSYSTRITGSADPVVTDEHIRIVLYEHKGYLLADALYVV